MVWHRSRCSAGRAFQSRPAKVAASRSSGSETLAATGPLLLQPLAPRRAERREAFSSGFRFHGAEGVSLGPNVKDEPRAKRVSCSDFSFRTSYDGWASPAEFIIHGIP